MCTSIYSSTCQHIIIKYICPKSLYIYFKSQALSYKTLRNSIMYKLILNTGITQIYTARHVFCICTQPPPPTHTHTHTHTNLSFPDTLLSLLTRRRLLFSGRPWGFPILRVLLLLPFLLFLILTVCRRGIVTSLWLSLRLAFWRLQIDPSILNPVRVVT